MLTEIPVKDWIGCAATPSSLSALAHPTEPTEKRFAVRLTLADSNCQCAVVLYHELVLRAAADMNLTLPEGLQDSAAVRLQLRDIFRTAQWLCRFTFRENDYQQTLELECRHLTPCLRVSKQTAAVDPAVLGRQVDAQLGLISVGAVDASFVRCLVAFNDVQLPDDEALQQDNTSSSRVTREPDFNRELQIPVGTAGLQLRAPDRSGHCRTSTGTARTQWALPDFNLQFCGVYTSLAADIKGHARLARGEIIIETFKAVKLNRWQKFMNSLHLDQKVDFEQGDIGLAGGIKTYEPALAHPVAKDAEDCRGVCGSQHDHHVIIGDLASVEMG
eukprot:s4199_g3.t1